MNALARFQILAALGVRNLWAHRIKSTVVGSLMFLGTFLVVLGTALLDSVTASMERSVTSSLSGNAQVYSADGKDDFSLFPAGSGGSLDYGEIDDFPAVRATLLEVDNVKDVVPMGILDAIVFGTPELDRVLEALRHAVEAGDAPAAAIYEAHVRAIAGSLRTDVEKSMAISADPEGVKDDLVALDEVATDAFWTGLQTDPTTTLQFLDTKIAPLAMDGRLLYFRLLGTDLHQYARDFDGLLLLEGAFPPPGEPGVLLSKRFYEREVKTKVARNLDLLLEGHEEGKSLAVDPELKLLADRLPKQVQSLLYQLTPADALVVKERLSTDLGVQGELRDVLSALLTVDDATIEARHALFYEVVAPRIRLYEAKVGDEIVLRSFTKSGYQRAAGVKLWGTFAYAGLEKSDIASATNLVDMDTFRTLYGRMTAAQQAELAGIRSEVGVRDISRESVEDALFGSAPEPVPVPVPVPDPTATPVSDSGLALNAAVILDDPSKTSESLVTMQKALDDAGYHLKVIDWQTASGFLGQLLFVLQAVLTIAVLVIFLVALVIINNTLVMATMERTTEIGTLRAIGAPRRFIIALFVVETLVLGVVAGGAGAATAVALITWWGVVGIPAFSDILILLFAGPRLYPTADLDNVIVGLVAILGVSLLSALYPALLAARVPPVVAMSGREST